MPCQDKAGEPQSCGFSPRPGVLPPQGSGLSCPEQRGQMASWPHCDRSSPMAGSVGSQGWGAPGCRLMTSVQLSSGLLPWAGRVSRSGEWLMLGVPRGFVRCRDRGRAPVPVPETPRGGSGSVCFRSSPWERIEDVSTLPPPTLSLYSCSRGFCKAIVSVKKRTTPASDPRSDTKPEGETLEGQSLASTVELGRQPILAHDGHSPGCRLLVSADSSRVPDQILLHLPPLPALSNLCDFGQSPKDMV